MASRRWVKSPRIPSRRHLSSFTKFKFTVALRPRRPYWLLGTGSPGRPPPLSHSSCGALAALQSCGRRLGDVLGSVHCTLRCLLNCILRTKHCQKGNKSTDTPLRTLFSQNVHLSARTKTHTHTWYWITLNSCRPLFLWAYLWVTWRRVEEWWRLLSPQTENKTARGKNLYMRDQQQHVALSHCDHWPRL